MTAIHPPPPALSSPHAPPSSTQSPSVTHHTAPILCPKPHLRSSSECNLPNQTPSTQAIVHHFQSLHHPPPKSIAPATVNTTSFPTLVGTSVPFSSSALPESSPQPHSPTGTPYQPHHHPQPLPPPPLVQPHISSSQRRSHQHNHNHHYSQRHVPHHHHGQPTVQPSFTPSSQPSSSQHGLPHLPLPYHHSYGLALTSSSNQPPSSTHTHTPLHPLSFPLTSSPSSSQQKHMQQDPQAQSRTTSHPQTSATLSLPIPTYSSGLIVSQSFASHRPPPQPRKRNVQPLYNQPTHDSYSHPSSQHRSQQYVHASLPMAQSSSHLHTSSHNQPSSLQQPTPTTYLTQHVRGLPSYPGLATSLNLCNPGLSSATTPLTHGLSPRHPSHQSLPLSHQPPQSTLHNTHALLSPSHNQPLAFTHNPHPSFTNPTHSSLLRNTVPSHQALNNLHNLPQHSSAAPGVSFQMTSHPQSLHQASSYMPISERPTPIQQSHSIEGPSQNPDLDVEDVHHHAIQQSKTASQTDSQTASNCHENSSLHNIAHGHAAAAAASQAHGIAHSHMRNSDDVDDTEVMMNFDTIQPTDRNQDMASTLAQSAAFPSEQLTHTVTDGASVMDALLPEPENDTLNVPLQMSLGMDTPIRTLDRSLLVGSNENISAARASAMAPNSNAFLSSGAVVPSSAGNQNAFPLHVSQSAGFAYASHGIGDNMLLNEGPSASFSVAVGKDALGNGTVATEVVAPMLMLGREAERTTDGLTGEQILGREEGDDIETQQENAQAARRMMQVETMPQNGMVGLSDGDVGVEGATSQGAANSAFGCNQISIQDLTKPKPECMDASTSQNAQFSPSSPAYSAVTITSPPILQPPQSLASAAVARDGANVSGTALSHPVGGPNGVGDVSGVGAGGFDAIGDIDVDDGVNNNGVANRVATVTQSNVGMGSNVQSPTSVSAPSGLICPICKNQFTRRYNLKVHMTSKHSARRDYHCKQCPNAFNRGDSLKRHIATTHRGEKKWRCSYCQRDFGQRPHMKMHIDTVHLKKRDHKCHCGKAFGTRYNLMAHQRTHQQTPKKHVCAVCDKSFALKSSLARHQRNSGHGVVDGVDDKTILRKIA